jgi:hypothetical protein
MEFTRAVSATLKDITRKERRCCEACAHFCPPACVALILFVLALLGVGAFIWLCLEGTRAALQGLANLIFRATGH